VTSLHDVIRSIAIRLQSSAGELNRLDGEAGDGDLGVTFSTAAASVLALLPDLGDRSSGDVLKTCGMTIARDAPSTCGTLVASALIRAGTALQDDSTLTFGRLLEIGTAAIIARGKAEEGSKTLLDALAPAARAAVKAENEGGNLPRALVEASRAAEEGSRSTVTMRPRYGRAGWLAERSLGHEDAGARLVAIVLHTASQSVSPRDSR
jgi:phosphoenolpyruvate---glycerone phosphotransferase subunit DhaL